MKQNLIDMLIGASPFGIVACCYAVHYYAPRLADMIVGSMILIGLAAWLPFILLFVGRCIRNGRL